MLDGNIRNLPFGPIQYGKQRMIAAINILAKFELALIIDESRLVSQVDWDEGRKLDVRFVGAIRPADAILGVAFTWSHHRQQHLGIFHGILYLHAAVAFGTPIIGEKLFLVRVVLVDQKLVGKIEADLAERVLFTRWLGKVNGAIWVVTYVQSHSLQYCRILLQQR